MAAKPRTPKGKKHRNRQREDKPFIPVAKVEEPSVVMPSVMEEVLPKEKIKLAPIYCESIREQARRIIDELRIPIVRFSGR
ncbi:hypothetical protein H1S01_03085 [Heliobacterium chlorum]|uniref:Uncharacterized protein n=1 Tax=Heliobacterium chlorum TaxID=2698 RepID=A0ABR7SZR8_HELCL|nr:hypothetical protein [Heliobacterium chlorum]MBC9783495.1 hypothetical protein [Heliobacterium chlorum]